MQTFVLALALAALGSFPRWGKVEIPFPGPSSQALGERDPFAIPLDVVFTAPGGAEWTVPGFYDGWIWKVRFSADRNGGWQYRTKSAEPALNGLAGSFEIHDPDPSATGFYRHGRLEYVGQRYLKFREGGFWLKAGADEPENLLGAAFGGWPDKKKQIDYLAAIGINSIYVMTHNLDGDGKDVWPWMGDTAEEARRSHLRFDGARLERWRDFLEYAQSKGLVIQIVLEDDSAWAGYDHARYYREIVARFGYLPAIYFNFCEEYNERYSLDDALGYMALLKSIDPYNHPRAVHNVNSPVSRYVDHPGVEVTSIQTQPSSPAALNRAAIEWFEAALVRNRRPLVVSFDEGRPADRKSWWSVYLGGGIWELYEPAPSGYSTAEPLWRELAAAGRFMATLPVERMFPANHLVENGAAFCLARPGEVYALYLPAGGDVAVSLTPGNRYRTEWFDPRSGTWGPARIVTGGRRRLAAPDGRDWALRILRTGGAAQAAVTAAAARVASIKNDAVAIHLAALPGDAPGPLAYEIVAPPSYGTLTGAGSERVYWPKHGFTGRDEFRWRAKGPHGASNVATIAITCSASGVNVPPRADNQAVGVRAGRASIFILNYTDPDGPGPFLIRIVTKPKHGAIQGMDNDITYTPAAGFRGEDRLEWLVSDGEARSNRATVAITVQ